MIDSTILKALSEKSRFNSLRHYVPVQMLTPETKVLLQWFEVYFKTYPEHVRVQPEVLKTLIRLRSSSAPAESLDLTMRLVDTLFEYTDGTAIAGIVNTLTELDFAGRVGSALSEYEGGGEIDLVGTVNDLAKNAMRTLKTTGDTWISSDIAEVLQDTEQTAGLKWMNLPVLHDHIGSIRGGISIALAARPDQGKSSFMAYTVTQWAPQCVKYFGVDRPILWLNNEGSGRRILPRLYQAALGVDLNTIREYQHEGTLVKRYEEAIGAPNDYIKIKDVHGASLSQIEQIIQEVNPCVVLLDMVANVRTSATSGTNKADSVEKLWQEWRELQVMYDFVGLGTVQISVEGSNRLYPSYSALKDSKTAVQGATDLILMLGSLERADASAIRGISTPKNKLAMPGMPSHAQAELYFNATACTFEQVDSAVPTDKNAPEIPNLNKQGAK